MSSKPDYYGIFLNGLAELIDDAELSRWDEDGIAHLREANEFFQSDYRIRRQEELEAAQREADMRQRFGED